MVLLPPVIRGVAFFHRDKNSVTRGANFSSRAQCSFHGCSIIRQIDNSGGQKDRIARRRWSEQFDGVFRGDGAWRAILFCALHQIISSCPVAMAIEQRADDAAIQDSIKSFILLLRFPFSDDSPVIWETSNVQPMRVRRAAAPAGIVRCVFFLK